MDLTCPKCQAPMRSYERSGVTVDQCTECRGIFLDRGELERLVDADTRFQAGAPAAPAAPAAQPAPAYQPSHQQQYAPQQSYGNQSYGHQGYGQKPHKKRKSFFEELFD
jgi:Zn-finger nucleic acid-binding protein